MKIPNINNTNPSFKRVIRIKNIHSPVPTTSQQRYIANDNINQIDEALNNKPSAIYSEEDIDKLKKFFAEVTGDYDNKVLIRRVLNCGTIVMTGKDYDKITKLEQDQEFQYNPFVSVQDVTNPQIENAIIDKLEDGTDGKRDTLFQVYTNSEDKPYDFSSRAGVKADKIEYSSSEKTFFLAVDGHACMDKMLASSDDTNEKVVNLVFDYSEIKLD